MCDDVFDEEDESCLPETNEWQRLKQARTAVRTHAMAIMGHGHRHSSLVGVGGRVVSVVVREGRQVAIEAEHRVCKQKLL